MLIDFDVFLLLYLESNVQMCILYYLLANKYFLTLYYHLSSILMLQTTLRVYGQLRFIAFS